MAHWIFDHDFFWRRVLLILFGLLNSLFFGLLGACQPSPPSNAHIQRVFFSFEKGSAREPEGLGEILIDLQHGRIQQINAHPISGIHSPKKIAFSQDGQQILVTSENSPVIALYGLLPRPSLIRKTKLPSPISDLCAFPNGFLLADTEGRFLWIETSTGKLTRQFNAREALQPPGNKGERIVSVEDGKTALISFQKDHRQGKWKGNRLLVFDVETFRPRHDLLLQRDRPELHLEDPKEQGPNPELIFVEPQSDTLILTLDLYGALHFSSLDAALSGILREKIYLSTAADGSWGNSFPDRGLLFEWEKKPYLLISNASPNGGLMLFDVTSRKTLQFLPAHAGAESPVFIPELGTLATVISGKVKSRDDESLRRDVVAASHDLVVLNLSGLHDQDSVTSESIPFPSPLTHLSKVNEEGLVLIGSAQHNKTLWFLYDLKQRKLLDQTSSHGETIRVIP